MTSLEAILRYERELDPPDKMQLVRDAVQRIALHVASLEANGEGGRG